MTTCSIAPWFSVPNGAEALRFYQAAFGAEEVYRHDSTDGGLVARLSVNGAEFWISAEAPPQSTLDSPVLGGGSIRMALTVPDPDRTFADALAAGATEVFSVGEGHGWRLGRLRDPFGLHWEVGRPVE